MAKIDFRKLFEKVKRKPNVIGYSASLQPRIRCGRIVEDEKCFRIYVSRKLPLSKLSADDIIPREIDGIPVDIVEVGEIVALNKKRELRKASVEGKVEVQRPLVAGVSIGHYEVTAGTLGWYVKDIDNIYILSNNHVLANENKGKIGDSIVQPGMYDIADKGDWQRYVCGSLADFIPIRFETYACPYRRSVVTLLRKLKLVRVAKPNIVDVALAKISVPYEFRFIDVDTPVRGVNYDLKVGDKVQKTGRTTCHTANGVVVDLNYCGYVTYSRGVAFFEDQILIHGEGFSAGGDSGSLIMDLNFNAVGLLFAGSENYTVANKIGNVEDLLGVNVVIVK
jgi:hypothetical protein